jgi:hypothetical protein
LRNENQPLPLQSERWTHLLLCCPRMPAVFRPLEIGRRREGGRQRDDHVEGERGASRRSASGERWHARVRPGTPPLDQEYVMSEVE